MAQFNRTCMIFLLVCHCNYSLASFSSCLTLNNIVTLKSGSEVTQGHWNWCHSLGCGFCGFLSAFYSNYGRICSRLWDIRRQRVVWPWKQGLGSFNFIGNGTIW